MRRLFCLATLLTLAVAACGSKPTPVPTAVVPPTFTRVPTKAATPTPAALPTPTSLAEGLKVRLATPDTSPDCPDHYVWFFENRASECAGRVLNTLAALQHFEHGLMMWTQEWGLTYVLIDDGSNSKTYQEVSDPTGGDLPGADPNIVPPAGLFQPELGFARFWRGLAPGSEWVRNALGWATAPEQSYPALWQCNSTTSEGGAARCYFNGPRDEIIVLTRGDVKHWDYLQGPVR